MKILVTGVPGWLGNRFLEILTSGYEGEGAPRPWDIRALVMKGADASALPGKIERVEGNVLDPGSLGEALQGVDVVFHLVGIIHPKKIKELYEVNTGGTENMLKASAAAGVKRFIQISSNSVAGTRKRGEPLMVEADPPAPYMHYGRSKHMAELAVRRFHDEKKMETVILRPCWYYGPNQPSRQTTFFTMIKKGNPILFGDGGNLRSMSYLDNTAQAMILAADHPRAAGQTYWIADEKPYTTLEIYRTVAELLEVKNFRPRAVPGLVSEMCLMADAIIQAAGSYVKEIHVAGEMNKDIACSIEKARREIGYVPRIGLREGMRRSIEWCRRKGMSF